MLFRKSFFFLFVAILFNSCKTPLITFENPQPSGVSDQPSFANKLIGEYRNTDDSTILKITANGLFATYTLSDTNGMTSAYVDTLFLISETNILRKFKGYYFLNRQDKTDRKWQVELVQYSRGPLLLLSSIHTQDDMNKLKEITQQPQDTLPYNPSKKQIKQLIRKDGFTKDQEYVKIK